MHGDNGLGGVKVGTPTTVPVDPATCSAAQFIVRACRSRPGEVTIIALVRFERLPFVTRRCVTCFYKQGPMTNLSLALLLDPELPKLVRRIVTMGGSFCHVGNITSMAEANGIYFVYVYVAL